MKSKTSNSPIKANAGVIARLVFGILVLTAAVFPQTTPQAAIADAAAEYGLGKALPNTPEPTGTAPPRKEGLWQAFERGRVYWHPQFGTRVVKGKILDAWLNQNGENGFLGFPTASEIDCVSPDERDLFQAFEGGQVYWNRETNTAAVYKTAEGFGKDRKCFAPASGRFRVTINGFTCNRQTPEILALDGMDDEIYISSKNYYISDGGRTISDPREVRTYDIGDTSNGGFGQRITGGSSRRFGSNGGFRTGDSFPASPEKHTTIAQAWRLPLMLWEGTLTRREDAAVFVPTIWEWDGVREPFKSAWDTTGIDNFAGIDRLIAHSYSVPPSLSTLVRDDMASSIIQNITNAHFPRRLAGSLYDHPIGLREYDAETYRFVPQFVILTYDEAMRMVATSRSKNGEAFAINYTDADSLGRAEYTIWIQVEMLPR